MNDHRVKAGIRERGNQEVRAVAQENYRHRNGARRGPQGRNGNVGFEPAHQFLQDKDGAGDGGIKGGGQAGPGPGRHQHPAMGKRAAAQFSQEVRNAGPHLHGGPLPAQGQAGADGQHASQELHRQQGERGGGLLPV